jgi:hypothetical protein
MALFEVVMMDVHMDLTTLANQMRSLHLLKVVITIKWTFLHILLWDLLEGQVAIFLEETS